MDLYFNDLTQEAQDRVVEEWNFRFSGSPMDDAPVAVLYDEATEEKIPKISGEWEHIAKLVPILKDLDYTDINLYYEDCGIWTIRFHAPKLDCLRFSLVGD